MSGGPEHIVWARMIQRCTNRNCSDYPAYGGRGISCAREWLDFSAFIRDVGLRPTAKHSLHRLNNSLGYFPGNVVWASGIQQGRLKSNNRMITVGSQTKTLAEWVEQNKLTRAAVYHRISRGWTEERAVSVPMRWHR